METKRAIHFLLSSIAVISVLLAVAIFYLFINPALITSTVFDSTIFVLFTTLLAQIVLWAHLDNKKSDMQHAELLENCEELKNHFRKKRMRQEVLKMYMQSCGLEDNND